MCSRHNKGGTDNNPHSPSLWNAGQEKIEKIRSKAEAKSPCTSSDIQGNKQTKGSQGYEKFLEVSMMGVFKMTPFPCYKKEIRYFGIRFSEKVQLYDHTMNLCFQSTNQPGTKNLTGHGGE
ncbi:hypothetical protein BTVI_11752 [Pitangus sulphuratus]|nr:hypothetical protein BTVI_11752 [Pitangus sulphuratus]